MEMYNRNKNLQKKSFQQFQSLQHYKFAEQMNNYGT